jgi:two-component system, OmpR family, sensor histidine kinase KdpD
MDRHAWVRFLARWAAVPLAVGGVTLVSRAAGANEITAGFLLLAAVLGLATWGGWAVGAVASVAATLCLNYFFIPPTGGLTVDDPSNWVALGCFLAASTLVSRLVARARQEAAGALARQRELEVLYELSFDLFTANPGALGEAAARTLRALGAEAGALVLAGSEPVILGGPLEIDGTLLDAARKGSGILEDGGTSYIPLQIGGRIGGETGGVLLAEEPAAPLAVLEPAVRLLALAVERERLLQEAAHLEAVRQSDSLKTALLRAVSHDLRTPLTSMRLEIESLERRFAERPEALASLHGLARQQERLTRRIDNLLALARLEAGVARPHPEPTPAGSLFRAARESLALVLEGRPVEVRIQPGCPDLWADPSVSLEVLVNLLENAARAAPPEQPLELAAESVNGHVRIEVRDRGPGLPAGEGLSEGLGLQIARSLAEADGGSIELVDRPGGGTIARLDLPAAPELEEILAG